MKYIYIAKDLDGNILAKENTMPNLARKLKVSMSLIENRLKQKVNKFSEFKKEKNKMNIERIILR